MSENQRRLDVGSVSSGIVSYVEAGPELKALSAFIGNWINEGHLVGSDPPDNRIVTSDVYEWAPGGFFVIHSGYGRLAGVDVGGVEIIGYDDGEDEYRSWFFDSQGNATHCPLLRHDDSWIWQSETVRSTSVFTDEGKTQKTFHERLENGEWVLSMEVVLTRVD